VTFREIVARFLPGHRHVAYVDLHTGLGQRGRAEPVFRGGLDAGALDRARRWYGDALTQSEDGTSSSTPIVGNTASAVAAGLDGGARLTAITLEVGTRSGFFVLGALRGDNWLHVHGDRASAGDVARDVAADMAEAFVPPDEAWRASAMAQADEVLGRAIAGLLGE
jgi:hypothetical protein